MSVAVKQYRVDRMKAWRKYPQHWRWPDGWVHPHVPAWRQAGPRREYRTASCEEVLDRGGGLNRGEGLL